MKTKSKRCANPSNRFGLIAMSFAATAVVASTVSATTFTWTRGAGNNNWDAAANWAGGAPPVAVPSGDTTDIVYAGTPTSATTSSVLRKDYSISSLTFASDFIGSGTSSVSVSTQSVPISPETSMHLTIGAGGITSNVTTFNLSVTKNSLTPASIALLYVPVDQTWATNAAAASGGAITFTIGRNISGAGRVTKTGTGVLVMGMPDPNTGWTGGVDLVEGSIRTGGLTGGSNGQFGTGSISSTSANDVSITASTISAAGGGGERTFDNDLILGGTGRLTLGGSFNLGFTANSEWNLQADKKLAISFVTDHAGTVVGAGGIQKFGGGMLVLKGANSYAGATTINEGVVHVTNSTGLGSGDAGVTVVPLGAGTIGAALELSNNITVAGKPLSISGNGIVLATPVPGVDANAGALRNRSGDNIWTGAVTVADPNTYIAVDAGSLNLSGGVSGAGSVRVAGAGVLTAANVRTAGLQIDGATKVQINANGTAAGASSVGSLTLGGTPAVPTATLDITNNALAIDYDGASPLADVKQLLAAGRLTGTGITSSAVSGSASIGFAEASSLGSVPTIFGAPVGDAVLLRATLAGDATLDGTVNFDDLLKLAAGYNQPGDWAQGDFTYDGSVNFDDLLKLAANYNQSFLSGSLSGDWSLARSAVPEPASLALVALTAAGSLRRRCRA